MNSVRDSISSNSWAQSSQLHGKHKQMDHVPGQLGHEHETLSEQYLKKK
jgi:hypothetical protein